MELFYRGGVGGGITSTAVELVDLGFQSGPDELVLSTGVGEEHGLDYFEPSNQLGYFFREGGKRSGGGVGGR